MVLKTSTEGPKSRFWIQIPIPGPGRQPSESPPRGHGTPDHIRLDKGEPNKYLYREANSYISESGIYTPPPLALAFSAIINDNVVLFFPNSLSLKSVY
jgi:hypothetical protein